MAKLDRCFEAIECNTIPPLNAAFTGIRHTLRSVPKSIQLEFMLVLSPRRDHTEQVRALRPLNRVAANVGRASRLPSLRVRANEVVPTGQTRRSPYVALHGRKFSSAGECSRL